MLGNEFHFELQNGSAGARHGKRIANAQAIGGAGGNVERLAGEIADGQNEANGFLRN
jgi:hypothetical protein